MSDTYSTQFLLLFSQMVHQACIAKIDPENFKVILQKLNNHPIVNGTLQLDSKSLSDLYLILLKENGIDANDVGQGSHGKRPPEFANKLCEVYYSQRMDELKEDIKKNSELFNQQLSELEAQN